MDISDLELSMSYLSLQTPSSLTRLFLMKTSSRLVLAEVMWLMFWSTPALVRKLNLTPRICILDLGLATKALTMEEKPLSLIRLCPISKNQRVQLLAMMLSAMDLAPSQLILLLKTFRYFRLLLAFRDLASSSAPETPMLFLLRSSTSSTLLWGSTSASNLTPSFCRLFLERSITFSWHLSPSLLESKAKTRTSAMFLCKLVLCSCRLFKLGLLPSSLTISGSTLLMSLLQWERTKVGLRFLQVFNCSPFKLLKNYFLQFPGIIFATLLGSPYHCYSSYSLTFIPRQKLLIVLVLEKVPVRFKQLSTPFLLALKATAAPISLALALSYPLPDRSSTLRLLQSPRALQNSLFSWGFRLQTLLILSISMLELILSILKRETTVSVSSRALGVRVLEICMSFSSRT